MNWKLLFYYFIVGLIINSPKNIEWDYPHLITLTLIIITLSIFIIVNIVSIEEQRGIHFRYILLGIILASIIYSLEEYLLV